MKHKRLSVFIWMCCFMFALSYSKSGHADQTMVSAHTSGAISREGTIRVRFIDDMVDSSRLNKPLEKSPVSFNPEIEGVAVWTDARTLEFCGVLNRQTKQCLTY